MTDLDKLREWLDAFLQTRLLRLSFPHDDAPTAKLLPNRFRGVERISRGFEFTVELLSDDASISLEEMHGKMLCISLVQAGGGLRPFTGYVWQFSLVKTDGGVAYYEAVLVPWFEFLRLRQNNRLFSSQTLDQQVQTILADHADVAAWEWAVTASDPEFTMAVQFGETDHNYISRRLEHAGFSYRFDHSDKGHVMVIGSDTSAADPIDGVMPDVRFHSEGGAFDEDAIGQWRPVRHSASALVTVSGYDFKNPTPVHGTCSTVNQQGGIPELEIHRYEGHYGFKHASGADELARRRMVDVEAQGKRFQAEGNCTRLMVGRWFKLADHYAYSGDDAQFLVLEIEHEATNNYLQEAGRPAEYKNRVICQPKAVPWQPGLEYNSTDTRILATQTATVIGPGEDGSLHVDKYGRVRVRFHWDREGKHSAWVRVSSQWAGGEKGMTNLPRVGSEVVIVFLDGNPDHPLITGCVVNQSNMPSWQLPEQKALSGIRSRELTASGGNQPGGRSNHVVLDDTPGQMQVQVKSDHLASQLSLGHITRIEDNSGRKDARGQGFELRTDGVGAVRTERGLLLSTEGRSNAQGHITDIDETVTRLTTGQIQHENLSGVAQQAKAHDAGDQDEVVQALQRQIKDIKGQGGNPTQGAFPEFQAPHLTLASPAGIETTTQGSTHMASAEHNALTSGGHTSISTGKSILASAKEAIRLFAYKTGMKLVAASGNVDIQALQNSIHILAKLDITQTANKITIQAKEEVVINGGGSFSKWGASGIEHGTSGKWLQQASSHSASGPANAPAPTITPPEVALKETPPENHIGFAMLAVAGGGASLLANQPYTLLKNGAEVKKGLFDEHGRLSVDKVDKGDQYQVKLHDGTLHEVPVLADGMQTDPELADHDEHRLGNKGYRADGQGGQQADSRRAQLDRGSEVDA